MLDKEVVKSEHNTGRAAGAGRVGLVRMLKPLLYSQWQQQRWQVILAAVAMAVLLAGTVRAQLVSMREAATAILWFGGYIVAGFLAISPIGGERSNGTWQHLMALPTPRAAVILAKWLFGVISIVCIVLMATAAGWIAGQGLYLPTGWLVKTGLAAAFGLGGWYIVLLLPTLRSRNEYSAAMMVLAVSVIGAIWYSGPLVLLQAAPYLGVGVGPLLGAAHPLAISLLGEFADSDRSSQRFWAPCIALAAALWWIVPAVVMGWLCRRQCSKARLAEAIS